MSRISCLQLTLLFVLGIIPSVFAQAILNIPTVSSSLHHQQYEARVLSLGQATSALGNNSGYSTNPAVPYSDSLVHVSGYIPKTYAVNWSTPIATQSLGAAFQYKNNSISITHDFVGYNVPYFENQNTLTRIQYGTKVAPNFYVGAGISISNVTQKSTQTIGFDQQYQPIDEISSYSFSNIGVSAGMYHQTSFSYDSYLINQEIGFVLSDLGGEYNLETNVSGWFHPTYLPTTLRLSLGWNATSKEKMFGKTLWGAGLYLGATKYFARTFDQESGFNSIFNNWGSFTYLNGQETVTVAASDQISNSIGFEITLLEVLSLRYGRLGGNNSSEDASGNSSFQGFTNADFFVRRQHGMGIELDLQYISFSYAKVTFIETDRWLRGPDLSFFQTTLRIPLYIEKALSMKDFFRI